MRAKDKSGRRWHPLFIRWCLNIALTSSKAYNIIRESEFVVLPSRRTLRDYTNYFKSKPGFQIQVDTLLQEESKWIQSRIGKSKYFLVQCANTLAVSFGIEMCVLHLMK